MNYQELKTELLAGHPTTGAYNVDDQLAADELNAVNRTINKASLSGDEIFNATDNTEFGALTDHKRVLWVSFCGKSINPFAAANVAFVQWIFGGGSTTVSNLAALRVTNVSRAKELELTLEYSGEISISHVATARAL